MVFDLFLLPFLFQLIRSESIDLTAYEVREHTLTRPYPSGIFLFHRIDVHIRINLIIESMVF